MNLLKMEMVCLAENNQTLDGSDTKVPVAKNTKELNQFIKDKNFWMTQQ